MTLLLVNRCRNERMPKSFLQKWVKRLSAHPPFRKVKKELVIVFVDKTEMRKLNRTYRGRDYATDVLSFESADEFGELVLCPQVLRKQGAETGLGYQMELAYMILHGGLHLLGYDHEKSKAAAEKMFRLQDRIFSKLKG